MARALSIHEILVWFVLLATLLLAGCASAPPQTGSGIVPPVAPSDLSLVLHPEGSLVLEWRDNSYTETSFVVVEDCGVSRGWVGSVGQNQTRVAVEGAPAEAMCSFVVFAANEGGLSGPSNVATIGNASVGVPESVPASSST